MKKCEYIFSLLIFSGRFPIQISRTFASERCGLVPETTKGTFSLEPSSPDKFLQPLFEFYSKGLSLLRALSPLADDRLYK